MVETKLCKKLKNLKIGALATEKGTIVRQFVDWYYFSEY